MSDTNCDQSSDDVLYSQICYLFFFLTVCIILLLPVIQEGFLCLSSSCRVSGQRMWLMAPVWLSTTSTGWWPLAAPGTCLCKRLPLSPSPYIVYRAVLESDLGCVCWMCVCVVQRGCCQCGVCVCPVWESVSLCLLRLSSVYSSGTPHAEQ